MTAMSQAEKEAFLSDVHVGVLGINRADRGPLTVPVWYDYTPGGTLHFITGGHSRKGKLISSGDWLTLCAQTEEAPYKYVQVEGRIQSIKPSTDEIVAMAIRYLGEEMGRAYAAGSSAEDSILVTVEPVNWLAVDYSKAT